MSQFSEDYLRRLVTEFAEAHNEATRIIGSCASTAAHRVPCAFCLTSREVLRTTRVQERLIAVGEQLAAEKLFAAQVEDDHECDPPDAYLQSRFVWPHEQFRGPRFE